MATAERNPNGRGRVGVLALVVGAFAGGLAVGLLRSVPIRDAGPSAERGAGAAPPRLGDAATGGAAPEPARPADSADGADPTPPGRWSPRRRDAGELAAPSGDDPLAELGYAAAYTEGGEGSGVVAHDPARAAGGLTLFCSGHATTATLMTAAGEVVHEWRTAVETLWPEGLPFTVKAETTQFLRRAHLFPNGDLLVVIEYVGLAKLDRDSNVLWSHLGRNHHDVDVAPDGTVVALGVERATARELKERYPGVRRPGGLLDDRLVLLSPDGAERRSISILGALYRSEYAQFLATALETEGEVFHANSVDWIEPEVAAAQPLFRAGDVLVSVRNQNALLAIDPEAERVTWLGLGKWRRQHQARALANGNVLLLDNLGGNRRAPLRHDRSRALELDPVTQRIVWEYPASDDVPLFTRFLGYVQRLPGGNTLITESEQGRILEVTPGGDLVWEYVNPHRAGADGEWIATIMGAQRLDAAALGFLDR